MDSLGFTVPPEKSVLIPQQILPYLGFILDSVQMKVTLTEEKMVKIVSQCTSLMNRQSCSIRELAEVISTLVALEPGINLKLHFTGKSHLIYDQTSRRPESLVCQARH